jgi:hypothetical protein
LFNTGREAPVQPPFDKVTHEISDKEFRSAAGEKQVGKKVHKPISYPSPFRTSKEKKSIIYNNIFRLTDQEIPNAPAYANLLRTWVP